VKTTFLGTGTSLGVPIIGCKCGVCRSRDVRDKRQRSSVLVEIDGRNIIIDTGPDFRAQCLSNNIEHIDAILVTHPHRDHIAGLDDIRPFCYIQKQYIPVYASPSTCNAIQHDYSYCFATPKYPGVPDIELHQIKNYIPFDAAGIQVTPFPVMHAKMEVTAYRFRNFTYITDAWQISEESVNAAKGTQYLVVNALRKEPHPSHFNLEQALDFIATIKPEHAYLTHIGHSLGYEETQAILPPNVQMAYDGLSITIPD